MSEGGGGTCLHACVCMLDGLWGIAFKLGRCVYVCVYVGNMYNYVRMQHCAELLCFMKPLKLNFCIVGKCVCLFVGSYTRNHITSAVPSHCPLFLNTCFLPHCLV